MCVKPSVSNISTNKRSFIARYTQMVKWKLSNNGNKIIEAKVEVKVEVFEYWFSNACNRRILEIFKKHSLFFLCQEINSSSSTSFSSCDRKGSKIYSSLLFGWLKISFVEVCGSSTQSFSDWRIQQLVWERNQVHRTSLL